jgi:hypothetical protein
MSRLDQKRLWFWIAALAIVATIAFLLIPHADSSHAGAWLTILPFFFVGLISPLVLLGSIKFYEMCVLPDAPSLSASFERPPPSYRG